MSTLGIHLVKSAYGQWLPGDVRGHWSPAWDARFGFGAAHRLNRGDPVRHRMAREIQSQPAVLWSPTMIETLGRTFVACAEASTWSLAALAIEPTHLHALLRDVDRDADRTIKWLSDRMAKAVHVRNNHDGPVFAKGRWR
ncbi:MAG: hypothetical protein AAF663_05780, partial [Planctomycetota bacterium]